jgi:hypothetical protein
MSPTDNSDIPRGVARYEGPLRVARYEGTFNSTSRYMRLPEGTWDKPDLFWTAFGFHGTFDENLETFSGEMDHHKCKTINLKKFKNG